VTEPTAMALATATREGSPSVRMVLLKGADERGFTFFTDYRSLKSRELDENPQASICFYWRELERQVRVFGHVSKLSREESLQYYESRPLGSRLGAWASEQGSVLRGRSELDERLRAVEARFGTNPPLPPHWGGFVLAPQRFEFWQARENRLHDRVHFRHEDGRWIIERLSP
jgi:pyridoxamine 5'-phosphate oxidase